MSIYAFIAILYLVTVAVLYFAAKIAIVVLRRLDEIEKLLKK